ncbi:YdeI/OmpD-associated family protein [Thalassotalea agariperforans]
MTITDNKSTFSSKLLKPIDDNNGLAFVFLPHDVSDKLPRRGRTSVDVTLNDINFCVQLEPDGQKSHWLRIDKNILDLAKLTYGDIGQFEISAVAQEPEPILPADFDEALKLSATAQDTWLKTTTLARVDWIHWITTAKQAKTRSKRIQDAIDMLDSGKKRVCCFDPSGFYSKALSAPSPDENI